MRVASLAFGLFFAAFLLHWIVWRLRLPQRQMAALLLIFFAAWPVGLAATMCVPSLREIWPFGLWEYLHVSTMYVACALGYAVVYTAIEHPSPSMTLLTYVADSGGRGRTKEQLLLLLARISPVEVRFDGLITDSLIEEKQGTYRVTSKGLFWGTLFSWGRRLFNLEKGG